MESQFHQKFHYGIFYPSHIHGVGSPRDLLAFFEALELVSDNPRVEYPLTWSLYSRPVFGEDMLELFDEMEQLRERFENVVVNDQILDRLGLLNRQTYLETSATTLAGVFELIFKILSDDAPEWMRIVSTEPDDNTLERGSVRLGPIEPLIPSEFFSQLPAPAFDDKEPPLWLRDEIFDEAFYAGKLPRRGE